MSEIIMFVTDRWVLLWLCIGVIIALCLTAIGWKRIFRHLKKHKVIWSGLLFGLAAVFFLTFFTAGLQLKEAGDYTAMAPNDKSKASYDSQEISLDFAEKERISLGFLGFHGKYGFRKEVVVEKPAALSLGMPPDFNMEHIHFGIYRDKKLTDPIDEADAGYNFNADWHMEEGAEYADYPDYKTGIFAVLQPGTYYLAVYSTSPFDKAISVYTSWYDVLDSDLTLEAGKYQYFYAEPGKEYEFPFTAADNEEIVLETAGIAGTLTLYDIDGKTVMETLEIAADQPYKNSKKSFTFKKGGTYYFRLTDYPQERFREHHYGWGELHRNYLRYKSAE